MVHKTRWKRAAMAALLLGIIPGTVLAEPYWIAYEGNYYPENEGWWRIWYDIPAERSLEDGSLVMNTLSDPHIAEYYEWPPNGSLNPDPGEVFVMRWRVRVDQVMGNYDPTIVIGSDDGWAAGFKLWEDKIQAAWLFGVDAPFEPRRFHDFEFRSRDMRTYELYIDGLLGLEGPFIELAHYSRVAWGPSVAGAASLTRWDYVGFGVIPEPGTIVPTLMCALLRRGKEA